MSPAINTDPVAPFCHPGDEQRPTISTRIKLPDFFSILHGWPFRLNPLYEKVHPVVDEWLFSLTSDEKMHKMIVALNSPLVVGYFFPDAEWEQYRILASYIGWLFLWDDPIDCGELTHDREGRKAYIVKANSMIDRLLESSGPDNAPSSSLPLLQAYEQHLAPALRADSPPGGWKRMLEGTRKFFEGVGKLHRSFPTVEEYCAVRRWSAGLAMHVAQLEYANGLALPDELFENEAMKEVYELACDLPFIINDIVSFPKEIAEEPDGQVSNLVFLLYRERSISLQEAIDEAGKMVSVGRERFDQAASRVPRTGDTKTDAQIERFIEGCKEIVTGTVSWSFECRRYFGSQVEQVRKDLCVDLVLPAEFFNRR